MINNFVVNTDEIRLEPWNNNFVWKIWHLFDFKKAVANFSRRVIFTRSVRYLKNAKLA